MKCACANFFESITGTSTTKKLTKGVPGPQSAQLTGRKGNGKKNAFLGFDDEEEVVDSSNRFTKETMNNLAVKFNIG